MQDQVKTESGLKAFLTSHFPSFLSSFSSHCFGTSNFSKGFQADNLCHHKNSLVWTQVSLSRHWSQPTFSSLCLSSLSLVAVVASRQHSCFTLWLQLLLQGSTAISFLGCRCCFKTSLLSFIPSLAVTSRQQFRINTLHPSIQLLVLSTVPSLESLLTPWNAALCDLIIPVLHWYPVVRTPAVSYEGKKAVCSLQLITLQGI